MKHTYYRTGQFARKARITERTLRYYDKVGLLSPSHYTKAGFRMYSDEDFPRLQQILALKYLGFSLEEIQACLKQGPQGFRQALAAQKAMLRERMAHLESIVLVIEKTEARLEKEPEDWQSVLKTIEAFRSSEKNEWIRKYFNEEQLKMLNQLASSAYTEADQEKIAGWGRDWTEADQREADQKWEALYAEARRLADEGQDPAGEAAQSLAARWMALVGEFTHGDPGVSEGLKKFWEHLAKLPPENLPFPRPFNERQQAFVDQALAIYPKK